MNKEYDLVVIGRGLAGHGLIDSYLNNFTSQIPDILWIGKNPVKKENLGCSISSTAMVAKQGIVKGLSPLGDLLFDSYQETLKFIDTHGPSGVERVSRYHIAYSEESTLKLQSRFGDLFENIDLFDSHYKAIKEKCFLFEPNIFLNWWSNKISRQVTIYDDFVTKIKKDQNHWLVFVGDEQRAIKAKKVVLATGALGETFFKEIKKTAKVVPGHYLSWQNVNFDEAFVLTIEGHNLMYRKETMNMVLSGTSVQDNSLSKKAEIYEYLELFKKHAPNFIPKSKPSLNMGMRQKGKKRTPFYQEIDHNLFQIDSFYKNGYSFCHEIGKRLSLKL